jgi:CBS domain-containing protein
MYPVVTGGETMKQLTAQEIMTRDVVVVRETMSISELAGVLMSNMITGAPVVSDSGKLLGVVSATDVVRHVALETSGVREDRVSSYYVHGWEAVLDEDEVRAFHIVRDDGAMVRDIMTPVIFSVPETAGLAELADTMIGGRIHRVIVTRGDDVVGVVSTLDLLKVMRSYLEET